MYKAVGLALLILPIFSFFFNTNENEIIWPH